MLRSITSLIWMIVTFHVFEQQLKHFHGHRCIQAPFRIHRSDQELHSLMFSLPSHFALKAPQRYCGWQKLLIVSFQNRSQQTVRTLSLCLPSRLGSNRIGSHWQSSNPSHYCAYLSLPSIAFLFGWASSLSRWLVSGVEYRDVSFS